MHSDRSSIRALLDLRCFAAKAMSSPLITHLCAAHRVAGEESAVMFSRKYCKRHVVILCEMLRSVSKELLRLHIGKLVCDVGNVKVMEIGLWSERSMGSIVASVRRVRSYWEMKK